MSEDTLSYTILLTLPKGEEATLVIIPGLVPEVGIAFSIDTPTSYVYPIGRLGYPSNEDGLITVNSINVIFYQSLHPRIRRLFSNTWELENKYTQISVPLVEKIDTRGLFTNFINGGSGRIKISPFLPEPD